MGLFDKKYCDICGEKIGLFGNRKVEDGNMCKHCAKKLSPWFDDRRHSTLADIREQLEYREQNRQAVADFQPTREIGEDMKVYVDENAGTFIVTRSKSDEWEEENPDVFSLDDVQECNLDVDEDRVQLYHDDEEGNSVPYNPRRYEYTYRFKMTIVMDHPFVDEIKYNLNEWGLKIEYSDRSLFGTGTFNPERDSEYRQYMSMADEIINVLTAESEEESIEDPGPVYQDESGQSVRIVTCPYCGSRSRMTYNGRCENCGGNLED